MTSPLSIAAREFRIPEADLTPMGGGHFSHVYSFSCARREYVLRLTPPEAAVDHSSRLAILAWMAHLAQHGVSVPAPLPSQKGKLIEPIPTVEGTWLASVFTRAPRVLSEEIPIDQWHPDQFEILGRCVGKMHAVAEQYDPASGLKRPNWNESGSLFNKPVDPTLPGHREKQEQIIEKLRGLPRPPFAYGMIHADLHFGNFYFDSKTNTITLIDFDDCALGWYVMDLAVLIFDVLVLYEGPGRRGFAELFTRQLLSGYMQEKDVFSGWIHRIPLLLKLLEINIYSMVHKSYQQGEGDAWVKKFMPGRLARIEHDIPYLEFDLAKLFAETAAKVKAG